MQVRVNGLAEAHKVVLKHPNNEDLFRYVERVNEHGIKVDDFSYVEIQSREDFKINFESENSNISQIEKTLNMMPSVGSLKKTFNESLFKEA